MKFKVTWMRAQTVLGTKVFDELPEAREYAEDNLSGVVASFGATAVKIISDDGTPQYLRSLSR
jgi:hypothetical protein